MFFKHKFHVFGGEAVQSRRHDPPSPNYQFFQTQTEHFDHYQLNRKLLFRIFYKYDCLSWSRRGVVYVPCTPFPFSKYMESTAILEEFFLTRLQYLTFAQGKVKPKFIISERKSKYARKLYVLSFKKRLFASQQNVPNCSHRNKYVCVSMVMLFMPIHIFIQFYEFCCF